MQGLASDDWILLFRSGQKQFLTNGSMVRISFYQKV
jgi:hypothetical protein